MTDFNSDNEEKVLQQAIQNHRSGNIATAKQLYERIIVSNNNASHAYHNLSIIMRGENNIDAALYHLGRARELDPTVEQFWKSSFTALISAKHWSELLNVLESSLAHHQYNPTLVDAIIETDVLNSICASVAEETLARCTSKGLTTINWKSY
jgi:tetratricopeptide (TPR) repeat protein